MITLSQILKQGLSVIQPARQGVCRFYQGSKENFHFAYVYTQ